MSGEWVLGIDVGTSRSAGAVAKAATSADGAVTSLEVDGNRWIASMVLLDPAGNLVVGDAADQQAAIYPDRVERTPKRYLGGPAPLLLGGVPVPVTSAIARLIRVFADEGRLRHGGRPPAQLVLTHPVRWGADRKAALEAAAAEVGYPAPILVPEPVAAAVHYVGESVGVGEYVGVYDLGGGTFDTAVLRRTEDGFESVGAPGGDEYIGGEHFDHLVYEQLGALIEAEDASVWEQMQFGEDRRWTRIASDLLTQARRVKEAVSAYPSTQTLLPVLERDVVFTRAQLEELITAAIERTVDEMAATITSAGITPQDLKALYLVGGSSRIPLVTRLMTARFGDRITTRDEPKSVVALGAALIARRQTDPRLRGPVGRYLPGWTVPTGAPISSVTGDGTRLAVVGPGRIALCTADGVHHWTAALPAPATAPATLGPSTVLIGCGNRLVLLGDRGGNLLWSAEVRGRIVVRPVVAGHLVLTADDRGTVTAMRGSDGWVSWILPINRPVVAPLELTGTSVLIAAAGGLIYRADVESGVVAWGFPAPTEVAAVIAVSAGTAAVVCVDGTVYALDITTGVARWSSTIADLPLPSRTDSPDLGRPRVAAGGVVVGPTGLVVVDNTGVVTCLDLRNGNQLWSAVAAATPGGLSGGVNLVLDGTVGHLGTPAGVLATVDLSTGGVVARQRIHGGPLGQPTVANGAVVVATGDQLRSWHLHAGPGLPSSAAHGQAAHATAP